MAVLRRRGIVHIVPLLVALIGRERGSRWQVDARGAAALERARPRFDATRVPRSVTRPDESERFAHRNGFDAEASGKRIAASPGRDVPMARVQPLSG